jgi:glucosamine--fructose-6-phosphate aminotransferase (isomerizing)
VALTNDAGSPLAQAAACCLPLAAGSEQAIAASKTYTHQLLALAMLSAAIEGAASRWEELAGISSAVAATLGAKRALHDVERLASASRFVVLGRGFNYATACEVALKIKETSYVLAEPYSWADFQHGPVALLEPGFPVVLVAPSGKVAGDVAPLLNLLERRGAVLVGLSDRPEVLDRSALPLPLPPGLPEWLSPICAAVPGQLLALALCTARGLDPDVPRGLSKVTETR